MHKLISLTFLLLFVCAASAAEKKWVPADRAVACGLLATSVDRVRVSEGKPQVYGTQFHEVDGVWVPQPIEDEANVDARRKNVGLPPLATALLRQMHAMQKE